MAHTDIEKIQIFHIIDPAHINPCTMRFVIFLVSASGNKELVLRASFTAEDYHQIMKEFEWEKKCSYDSLSTVMVGHGVGVFDREKSTLDLREYTCTYDQYERMGIYGIFRKHIGGWRIVNT